jgi:hypothetical protein
LQESIYKGLVELWLNRYCSSLNPSYPFGPQIGNFSLHVVYHVEELEYLVILLVFEVMVLLDTWTDGCLFSLSASNILTLQSGAVRFVVPFPVLKIK